MCFFHRRVVEQRARIAADQFAQRPFEAPVLEDANSVQMALMQVMQMLALRRIDHKTSGQMLYALQVASINLRKTDFEVDDATDVVIDRDTVHLTTIGGPQWFEEDFEEEEESEDEDGDEVDEEEDESEVEAAEENDDEPEVAAQEKEEDPAEEKGAETPVAARKPVQPAGEDLRRRLAMRVGENPVEAMKRLLATVDEMERSG